VHVLTVPCVGRRPQDWQVCQVSVGVLGDICRAIEEAVAPYCDRIMAVLLANLQVS
jgi:importin subunit beta-1